MKFSLLLAVLLIRLCAAGFAAEPKPNALFILTDDERADTIAALGNPEFGEWSPPGKGSKEK